jgi:8-oxo-dGTP pyrophosphatase MutT (NUDIX family)
MRPDEAREAWRGRLVRVDVERWGDREREILRHPGGCVVVPLTGDDDVLMVRQRREALRTESLEVPAGVFDVAGEDPPACAAREVFEETGHRIVGLQHLGTFHASPGFSDERFEMFVGRVSGSPPTAESEDGIVVERMPLDAAVQAVQDGRVRDAKSALALLLVARMLGRPIGTRSVGG